MGSASLLLLFDIDGTLLSRAHVEHREALHAALHEVLRIPEDAGRGVEAAGRTDPAIMREIALQAGLGAAHFDDALADLRTAAVEHYARLCPPDLRDRVVPGMPELLDRLDTGGPVLRSLLTGNLEPIARLKLTRAGLGHHFERGQGGFGSDHEDRAALPQIARRRAGRPGPLHPPDRTVVIGDTPNDIAAARADGCHVVAVTTGPYRADQLAEADAVARDPHEVAAALAAL
jgi:phosphoglycolate phosphatase-like HAD superfamily hydrolase